MTDVSIVIKKLLGGADKSTIQKVAMGFVDSVTKVYGEEYVLVPKTSLGANAKNVKPIKKPKKWGRIIEAIDYTAKPTGYAIKGGWANVYDLSKHSNGTLVMVSIPYGGLFLGEVAHGEVFTSKYSNGHNFDIKHFKSDSELPEGAYSSIVDRCKTLGVAQAKEVANA